MQRSTPFQPSHQMGLCWFAALLILKPRKCTAQSSSTAGDTARGSMLRLMQTLSSHVSSHTSCCHMPISEMIPCSDLHLAVQANRKMGGPYLGLWRPGRPGRGEEQGEAASSWFLLHLCAGRQVSMLTGSLGVVCHCHSHKAFSSN